jgi:small subunit ribosomal protein S27
MALTRLNSRLICSIKQSNLGAISVKRTFLSDSFDLKVEWNERLKAPIFGMIDMEKYFLDIDRQFSITGLASHIDLDIFANAMLLSKNQGIISSPQDIETRFEQIEELLRRSRTTTEAIKMLNSTPHAVVRNSLDTNQIDILMKLLNSRLKYGLILDDYTNTLLIGKLLKAENFRDASKSAILMMLQEEYSIPIAKHMATYASYMYINHLRTGKYKLYIIFSIGSVLCDC